MVQLFQYVSVRIIIWFFRFFPSWLSVWIGSILGRLFYYLDRRHRRVALDNLQFALGDRNTENELRQIALSSFQNLGRSAVEFTLLPTWTRQRILEKVEVDGFEHYLAARAQGKGVILLSAHFGNWEWMGTVLAIRGVAMHVVVRPIDNCYLDRMIKGWRERYGNFVINKKTAPAVELVKLLKKGVSVGFLLDQNKSGSEAVFVDYFGRPAATHKGLAILALRTQAPVVPVFMIRQNGGHRLVIEKPLVLNRTGTLKRDILEVTALFTRKIESYVRKYPDHWFWVHRRWKTSPPSSLPSSEKPTKALNEPVSGSEL